MLQNIDDVGEVELARTKRKAASLRQNHGDPSNRRLAGLGPAVVDADCDGAA